jgi:hypothetical protein
VHGWVAPAIPGGVGAPAGSDSLIHRAHEVAVASNAGEKS